MEGLYGVFMWLFAVMINSCSSYKPVLFMHGIFAAGDEANTFFKWIEEVKFQDFPSHTLFVFSHACDFKSRYPNAPVTCEPGSYGVKNSGHISGL